MQDDAAQRRENQSRFQDLCNSDLVDKAATAAAAAMLAADELAANDLSPLNQQMNHITLDFIVPPVAPAVQPPSDPIQETQPKETSSNTVEGSDVLFFPSRDEREAFGDRVRASPSFTVPERAIVRSKVRGPSFHTIEELTEETDEKEEHHVSSPKKAVVTSPSKSLPQRQNDRMVVTDQTDQPSLQKPIAMNSNDLNELKETAMSQWESASVFAEEQQQDKVCYLVKIEELKEDGVPVFREVNIDSDLTAIKLCYNFMFERSKRRKLLNRGKGLVKFGADIFGKASDFFQKNEPENDSSEWRAHFKDTIQHGMYDVQIRDVVDKYDKFQPPEEVALLEIMWESKQRFDDQRKKQRKAREEEVIKESSTDINGLEAYVRKLHADSIATDDVPNQPTQ